MRQKELVLVIGENGVGKTTLLSILIGFITASSGEFFLKGEKIKQKRLRRKIAMVMQRPADFFYGRSVVEELTLGADGATPDDVRAVLFAVGLRDISLLKKPRQLSGGQQKRLAVAAQLMRRRLSDDPPELMLLDEPLAGVDAAGRKGMARLVGALSDQLALVIVSHEPGELLEYADRVVQLAHGRLFEVDQAVLRRARARNSAGQSAATAHTD